MAIYSDDAHLQLLPEWLQNAGQKVRKEGLKPSKTEMGNGIDSFSDDWMNELWRFAHANDLSKVSQTIAGLFKLLLNTDGVYEKHIDIRQRYALRTTLVLEPVMQIIKFKKICPPFFQLLLGGVKGPKVIAFLLSFLEEKDFGNLYFAANTLNNMRTIEADVELVKFLHVKKRQTALSRIFTSWNDKRVLNLLEELVIRNRNEKLSDPVEYLLGPYKQVPVFWGLFKKLTNQHKVVQQSVIWLLSISENHQVVPFLIEIFKNVEATKKYSKFTVLSLLQTINIERSDQQEEESERMIFAQVQLSRQIDLFPFAYLMTKDYTKAKMLIIKTLDHEFVNYRDDLRPTESIFKSLIRVFRNNSIPKGNNNNFTFLDDLSEKDILDYLNTLAILKGIPDLMKVDYDSRVLLYLHELRKFSRFQIGKILDRGNEDVEHHIKLAREKAGKIR